MTRKNAFFIKSLFLNFPKFQFYPKFMFLDIIRCAWNVAIHFWKPISIRGSSFLCILAQLKTFSKNVKKCFFQKIIAWKVGYLTPLLKIWIRCVLDRSTRWCPQKIFKKFIRAKKNWKQFFKNPFFNFFPFWGISSSNFEIFFIALFRASKSAFVGIFFLKNS